MSKTTTVTTSKMTTQMVPITANIDEDTRGFTESSSAAADSSISESDVVVEVLETVAIRLCVWSSESDLVN